MKFSDAVIVGGLVAFATGCAHLPEGFPSRTSQASSPGDLFVTDNVQGGSKRDEEPGLKIRKSKRGNMESYVVRGQRYHTLDSSDGYSARGVASWYGPNFHGRTASNGEVYDMYRLTAAHKTLPLPTYAKVTHVENGRSVIVKINDRGPFSGDRIIDLSFAAALRLGMINDGTGTVDIQALSAEEVMALSGPENELEIDFYYANEDGSERELVPGESIQPQPEEVISVAAVDFDDNPITPLPITTPAPAPVMTDEGAPSNNASLSDIPVADTTVAEAGADGVLLSLDELMPEVTDGQRADAQQPDELEKQIQDSLTPVATGASVQGVAVVPAAVQAVPLPSGKDRGGYYVQAGVYADVADAERIAVDVVLAAPGEEVHVKPLKDSLMYRITVGPIVSQQHASDVSGKLSAAGLDNFTVNVK